MVVEKEQRHQKIAERLVVEFDSYTFALEAYAEFGESRKKLWLRSSPL